MAFKVAGVSNPTKVSGTLNPNKVAGVSLPAYLDLDTVGMPTAAYSVIKIKGYSGNCLRVSRSSDSTEQDIGFDSTGFVDMSAANTFASGSLLTVTKWYDQSGNGHDAVGTDGVVLRSENAVRGKQCVTAYGGYFTLPSSFSINRAQGTVISAQSVMGTTGSLWELGTSSSTRLTTIISEPIQVVDNSSFRGPGLVQRSQPQIVVLSSSSGGIIIHTDNTIGSSVAASGSASPTGGYLFKMDAAGYRMYGESFLTIFYSSTLSEASIATVKNQLFNLLDVNTAKTKNIVFDGDSATFGTGSTYGINNPRQVEGLLSERIHMSNVGVFGTAASTCYSNITNKTFNKYSNSYTKNIVVFAAGSNDMSAGVTANSIWTNSTIPYVRDCRVRGFDVCVGTIIPRQGFAGTSKEDERLAYNSLVTSNAKTYGYSAIDYASISELQNVGDTTYYADGVHPTTAGYLKMATLASSIIQPLLGVPHTEFSSVDFTLGLTPSWSSFYRGSGGYIIGSSGTLALCLDRTPRFKYNTSSVCQGFVVEPAYAVYSNYPIDSGYIGKYKCTTTTSQTDPAGTSTAVLVTEDSTTGTHSVREFPAESSVQRTWSCCFKNNGVNYIKAFVGANTSIAVVNVDLTTGSVINYGSSGTKITLDDHGIEDIGDSWYRVWITATTGTSVTSGVAGFALNRFNDTTTNSQTVSYAGDGTSGVVTFGLQYTEGSVKEIINTGPVVTTSADALTVKLPSTAENMLFTFYDDTTQQIDVSSYAGALYTVPTNLNKRIIKSMALV